MNIVLECGKVIKSDVVSILNSKFNSICMDADSANIENSGVTVFAVNLFDLNMDISNINFKYLIVKLDKDNYNDYLELGKKAKKGNFKILLENYLVTNKNGGAIRSKFSDADFIKEFIDKLNLELEDEVFGVCLDVKTCTLCAYDINQFIIKLGDKIRAIRLPVPINLDKEICTDWQGIIRGLRKIRFNFELILDCSGYMKFREPLLSSIFEFSYGLGMYIKDKIEVEILLKKYKSIVLFGAGFMFDYYMNQYGDKYLPLFVCDNNKSLWGKYIHGVEVKAPEELKNISEETGVFISNSIYCREIQAQLLEIGVKNLEMFDV